jgi:hypothetical protein
MKTEKHGGKGTIAGRRRLLRLLNGLGLLALAGPGAALPGQHPRALSLKEADFYRPHDLAG